MGSGTLRLLCAPTVTSPAHFWLYQTAAVTHRRDTATDAGGSAILPHLFTPRSRNHLPKAVRTRCAGDRAEIAISMTWYYERGFQTPCRLSAKQKRAKLQTRLTPLSSGHAHVLLLMRIVPKLTISTSIAKSVSATKVAACRCSETTISTI